MEFKVTDLDASLVDVDGISDKFSYWLKGHDFTVFTDNNLLTHILAKSKLDEKKGSQDVIFQF